MNTIKFRPDKPETHESFIWDDPQGELVYESMEMSSLERSDNEMIFTLRASKQYNWRELAEFITGECHDLCCWLLKQRKEHRDFEQLEAIPQEYFEEEVEVQDMPDAEPDDADFDGEEPLFMLTRTDHWWEMYEGDEEYLIRYRLPKCEKYPLSCSDDLDALQFLLQDEAPLLTHYLRTMYDKVNGITDEYEEDA